MRYSNIEPPHERRIGAPPALVSRRPRANLPPPGASLVLHPNPFDGRNPCPGAVACFRDEPSKLTKPLALLGRRIRAEPMLDCREQLLVKSCQFAQRWDLMDAAQVAESILSARQQDPRGETRQFIEGSPALPSQGTGPPPRLAFGVSIEAGAH